MTPRMRRPRHAAGGTVQPPLWWQASHAAQCGMQSVRASSSQLHSELGSQAVAHVSPTGCTCVSSKQRMSRAPLCLRQHPDESRNWQGPAPPASSVGAPHTLSGSTLVSCTTCRRHTSTSSRSTTELGPPQRRRPLLCVQFLAALCQCSSHGCLAGRGCGPCECLHQLASGRAQGAGASRGVSCVNSRQHPAGGAHQAPIPGPSGSHLTRGTAHACAGAVACSD